MTHRPLGYFLWGAMFFIIGAMLLAVPALIFYTWASGAGSFDASVIGELMAGLLIVVPVGTWLFIIVPVAALTQAGVAFVAAWLALLPTYDGIQIVEFVGGGGNRMMEARADSKLLQTLSAVCLAGLVPGWQFAVSAMVLTTGASLVLIVPTPGGAVAGTMLALVGAGGSVVGIRNRVNAELKKAQPKRKRARR